MDGLLTGLYHEDKKARRHTKLHQMNANNVSEPSGKMQKEIRDKVKKQKAYFTILYLKMHQIALKPSFQPIFLPSS